VVIQFVDDNIEKALSRLYQITIVAPRQLLPVTSWIATSMIFYTDGSLMDGYAEFAILWTEEGGFCCRILSPARIFTVKLIALFVTLRHIGEVNQLP
jgi:hypothetical protein